MRYWLMKSEPETFSIDDLKRLKRDAWSGVRNYQARNFMREMKVGDPIFFYHSSVEPPGIAGLMKVVAPAHFDAPPSWECVDVGFMRKFKRLIPLGELRGMKALKDMVLLRRGSRLSVQPVSKAEFDAILKLV